MSVGLLIVVCDQYFTDTPAVQVHVTNGVYTVAIKGGPRSGTDNPLSATDYSKFEGSKENIFRSHEPKAQVRFTDQNLSVVRCPLSLMSSLS